ncbi:hypothetical protein QFC20_004188 [Naganishia adeliensis]|uniref:Uncharacterized protein n=1 Tax=Naganishia adeliensis TaxID=92952 RepID=A0ACC2W329_9TREE|nr:hypothetical protein QFC20_004188 [Naganishia adeliensis]
MYPKLSIPHRATPFVYMENETTDSVNQPSPNVDQAQIHRVRSLPGERRVPPIDTTIRLILSPVLPSEDSDSNAAGERTSEALPSRTPIKTTKPTHRSTLVDGPVSPELPHVATPRAHIGIYEPMHLSVNVYRAQGTLLVRGLGASYSAS